MCIINLISKISLLNFFLSNWSHFINSSISTFIFEIAMKASFKSIYCQVSSNKWLVFYTCGNTLQQFFFAQSYCLIEFSEFLANFRFLVTISRLNFRISLSVNNCHFFKKILHNLFLTHFLNFENIALTCWEALIIASKVKL